MRQRGMALAVDFVFDADLAAEHYFKRIVILRERDRARQREEARPKDVLL